MGLHIPYDAKCLVPGCKKPPEFTLSLRMRRRNTGATWAPNQYAFFCDKHANRGSEITILYTPTNTGENHVKVAVAGPVVERTTVIR